MKEDRRHRERIVVPEDRLLSCEGVSRSLTGRISVLGTGGMFIRTADTFAPGTELELRIRANGETLEMPCVVRDVAPGGLGVEFTWVRGPVESKLRKIMGRLKL